MSMRILSPEGLHKPMSYYSQGIVTGHGIIYIAGQAAIYADGTIIAPHKIEEQIHQSFRNMQIVLTDAQAGFADIVKITVFIRRVDLIAPFFEIARQYFGEHRPAVTIIVVEDLAFKDFLNEFEAIVEDRSTA